jgi:hypothetical protein
MGFVKGQKLYRKSAKMENGIIFLKSISACVISYSLAQPDENEKCRSAPGCEIIA